MCETFHDRLADLVIKEVLLARKTKDDGRKAEVVSALAELLGRAAALVCEGDPVGIERLLKGVEGVVVEIAADTARQVKAVHEALNQVRKS